MLAEGYQVVNHDSLVTGKILLAETLFPITVLTSWFIIQDDPHWDAGQRRMAVELTLCAVLAILAVLILKSVYINGLIALCVVGSVARYWHWKFSRRRNEAEGA